MKVMEIFKINAGKCTLTIDDAEQCYRQLSVQDHRNRQVAINNRFILAATCFGSIWRLSESCQEYKDKLTV
jgi:hypothetical protein